MVSGSCGYRDEHYAPGMADGMNDNLEWLTHWYAAQCDGVWEHGHVVKIATLDNPGWSVKIDLSDTSLEGQAFEAQSYNLEAPDGDPTQRWYHCKVTDGRFEGAGGVPDLGSIIGVFRDWVHSTTRQ